MGRGEGTVMRRRKLWAQKVAERMSEESRGDYELTH